jgi:hypothetical protein
MAKKNDTQEKYYNFANMTDEEVDAVIIPVIEDCKAKKQKNGKITWTEPLLALRNSAIFDLMFKRGYSKAKTIQTLQARWQIGMQKCYDYINIAMDALNGEAKFADKYTEADKAEFEAYLNKQMDKIDLPNKDMDFLRHYMLTMYANPAINHLKAIEA